MKLIKHGTGGEFSCICEVDKLQKDCQFVLECLAVTVQRNFVFSLVKKFFGEKNFEFENFFW